MNSKISLPELSALLALQTGAQKKNCEDFVKSFFANISSALEAGENVKIKGFGTFKVTRVEARKSVNVTSGQEFEIPAHNRVSFVPSKELSAIVNSPFDIFETVELSDNLSSDILDVLSDKLKDGTIEEVVPKTDDSETAVIPGEVECKTPIILEQEQEIVDNNEIESEISALEPEASPLSKEPEESSVTNTEIEQQITPAPIEDENTDKTDEAIENPSDNEAYVAPPSVRNKSGNRKFGWGMAAGFLLAILLGVIVWLAVWVFSLRNQINNDGRTNVERVEEDLTLQQSSETENETLPKAQNFATIKEDSIVSPPVIESSEVTEARKANAADTKPSDAVTYDYISKTRFLTTMSRQYYGTYHFWPFIYDANPNLGHPSKIRPGTKIKIPSLSSLGADPKNPADVARAKKRGSAIYAVYNELPDGTKLPAKKPKK